MAYSSTNPVQLHSQGMAGLRIWQYNSSEGSTVILTTTGYFTDGVARGMKLGDLIITYGSSGGTSQGFGIGIVSSVAGYSGLPKALIYGPTKAALINLAESLYLDVRASGIGVYLINPGFVETPLTAHNNFPMPAIISAAAAAQEIVAGIEAGRFHIHFPRRFTNWLRLARLLPYRLYFSLVHKVTGL